RSLSALASWTGVLLRGGQQPGIPCAVGTRWTLCGRGSRAVAETGWKLGESREFGEGRRSVHCHSVCGSGPTKPLTPCSRYASMESRERDQLDDHKEVCGSSRGCS